jgi:hypothetical protein
VRSIYNGIHSSACARIFVAPPTLAAAAAGMPGLLPAVLNLLFKRCKNRFRKKEKKESAPKPADDGDVYRMRYDPMWNVLRTAVREGAFSGAAPGSGRPGMVHTVRMAMRRGLSAGGAGSGAHRGWCHSAEGRSTF